MSNLEDEVASCQRALSLNPQSAGAHFELGKAYLNLGKREEALSCFQQSVALKADNAEAYYHLGYTHSLLGRFQESIVYCQQALNLQPDYAEAHNNIGYARMSLGDLDAAIASFRQAVAAKPDYAKAHSNLGLSLLKQDQPEAALPSLQAALRLQPDFAAAQHPQAAVAHFELGKVYLNLGKREEALSCFQQAIALNANYAEACYHLGYTYSQLGRFQESIVYCQQALNLQPDYAEAHNNIGYARLSLGDIDAAITSFRQAVAAKPDYAKAHSNLGLSLLNQGQYEAAVLALQTALRLQPDFAAAHSGLQVIFYNSTIRADFDTIRAYGDMWEFFSSLPTSLLPLLFLRMFPYATTIEDNRRMVTLYRRWAEQPEQAAQANPLPGKPIDYSGGTLRLAILSSLNANNNVAKFLLPVLEELKSMPDVEIWYFSTIESIPNDPVQRRVMAVVHAFEDVSSVDPRAVAAKIREKGCHVAIDMDGLAPIWSMTRALCYRACSLQMSWLNWPGTLGILEVDGIVLDQFSVPSVPGMLCETPMIMPGPYYVTDSLSDEPVATAPPCVKNGFITFGTQSAVYKYTPALIALWSKVLMAMASSRFLIVRPECENLTFRENMLKEFERNGVARERIGFIDNPSTGKSHMFFYNDMDISLDTIPLTGGTTTIESLWMGVPVITYAGPNLHQRISHAQLCHLGLANLSGETSADYIANVVALAQDPSRITELKINLRNVIRSSKYFDANAFAGEFVNVIKTALTKEAATGRKG